MAKIGDFFVDLKVKGDTLTLKDMVARMGDLTLSTLAEITSLGVMADLMKNVAIQAMGTASTYTTLSKEFGINTELLQRWQNVAMKSNVPVEAVANSFANVQKILAGFRQGQFNEGFMRGAAFLNIPNAVQMSYDQLFRVLQTRVPEIMRSRGRAYTTNALQMMGIDPSMIQMFELTQRQFTQRQRGPVMTDAEIQKWTQLNNEIKTLEHNLQLLGQHFLAYFIGPLNSIVAEALRLTEGGKLNKAERYVSRGVSMAVGSIPSAAFSNQMVIDAIVDAMDKTSSSQTVNQKTDIHIHGDNAEAIGKEAARHVERQNRQLTSALQQANTAVAY